MATPSQHTETEAASEQTSPAPTPPPITVDFYIPLRLDLEIDGHKLKDTLTWNAEENECTPEHFAQSLCMELDLPRVFEREISQRIRQHIAFHRPYVPHPNARDVLVPIQLDILVDNVSLHDQFLWDLNGVTNSPEEFAKSTAADLGLSGEFASSIAHSIREQLYDYQMAALDGQMDVMRRAVTIEDAFRRQEDIYNWEPTVDFLTQEEVDKLEAQKEREARYKRRHGDTFSDTQRYSIAADRPRRSTAGQVSYYEAPDASDPTAAVVRPPIPFHERLVELEEREPVIPKVKKRKGVNPIDPLTGKRKRGRPPKYLRPEDYEL